MVDSSRSELQNTSFHLLRAGSQMSQWPIAPPRHPPRIRGHPNSHPNSLARDKVEQYLEETASWSSVKAGSNMELISHPMLCSKALRLPASQTQNSDWRLLKRAINRPAHS